MDCAEPCRGGLTWYTTWQLSESFERNLHDTMLPGSRFQPNSSRMQSESMCHWSAVPSTLYKQLWKICAFHSVSSSLCALQITMERHVLCSVSSWHSHSHLSTTLFYLSKSGIHFSEGSEKSKLEHTTRNERRFWWHVARKYNEITKS